MFLLDLITITCGENQSFSMDSMIPNLTTTLITIVKIGVPVLLIFFGMLDLGKAVMAQKEDEIKKGQQMFIKRLVTAVVVFLVIFIVQLVIGIVAGNDKEGIMHCMDCFTNYEETKCNN